MDELDILLSTGAPFNIDDLLAQPIAGSPFGFPVVGGGGDILVGDADLDGLLGLTNVGGGDILVETGFDGLLDDPMMNISGDFPEPTVGAPMSAAQRRALALRQQQARKVAAQRAAQQRAAQQKAALARAAFAKGQQQAAAMARAAQPQQYGVRAMVTPDSDSKYGVQPLPLDSVTDILPGAIQAIRVQPQKRCKPKRLVVANPEWWRIRNVLVGNKPQFIAQGSLPGILFTQDATDVTFIGDTAQIGQDVIVEVQNQTGANHRFEAGLMCHFVD